jgi:hypothetical protein
MRADSLNEQSRDARAGSTEYEMLARSMRVVWAVSTHTARYRTAAKRLVIGALRSLFRTKSAGPPQAFRADFFGVETRIRAQPETLFQRRRNMNQK